MFKYLDVSGAKKTLERRAIKFARPVDFNDPFDVNLEELLGADLEDFSSQLRRANHELLCSNIDFRKLKDNKYRANIIAMNTALKKATAQQRSELEAELMAMPFEQMYDRERLETVNRTTLQEIRDA